MDKKDDIVAIKKRMQELEAFFKCSIIDLAHQYNYSEENLLILQLKEAELNERYKDVVKNIQSCKHTKDKRSDIRYAFDLVSAWLVEDYIIEILSKDGGGLRTIHNGMDADRKILKCSKISSTSDYLICLNDKQKYLELVNDYTAHWDKYHSLDFRDNKYNRLVSEDAIVLAISIPMCNFSVFNIRQIHDVKRIEHHEPYGGKPACQMSTNKIVFQNFNLKNLCSALAQLIE